MGMSTRVIGFIPPDEEWQKMKTIWDACEAANVYIPGQVAEFFGGVAPDPAGVEVSLPVREWRSDMKEGYEIDVADIPAKVKTLRFYNSW